MLGQQNVFKTFLVLVAVIIAAMCFVQQQAIRKDIAICSRFLESPSNETYTPVAHMITTVANSSTAFPVFLFLFAIVMVGSLLINFCMCGV